MKCMDLSGKWHCAIPGMERDMILPGTLDQAGIGHPEKEAARWHPDTKTNEALKSSAVIATRLTRHVTYEGPARISRRIQCEVGGRQFIDVERARHLILQVNGCRVPDVYPASVSTPRCFEVTGLLTGDDELTFISDNSYPGWPHDAIVYSSAATDETQTNWNGLLGTIRLRSERTVFIRSVRVYPYAQSLSVEVELDAGSVYSGSILVESEALKEPASAWVSYESGVHVLRMDRLALKDDIRRWDEEEGNCYQLHVSGDRLKETQVTFGIRTIAVRDGRLTLNGRPIFLRSEANCAVFPETGYEPMTVEEWTDVLQTYRSYGVNCMRFHSHMPPEAAFTAADRMGMLMQPELGHWNPKTAFEDEAAWQYYQGELTRSIMTLCNHPSFVMLTLGNELAAGEVGVARMAELLRMARELDDTRLYAWGSNNFYGEKGVDPNSDFYTTMGYKDQMARLISPGIVGELNHGKAAANCDLSSVLRSIREVYDGAVYSFEVGQYEILPDFDELKDYHGVTRPDNLELIRQKVLQKGFMDDWKRRVEATGELSLLGYRAEVEAAMRTEGWSGISLLGLQDFPGQGTALVGMLDCHLKPKPFDFARPERFSSFFRAMRPLALLPSYTYEEEQEAEIPVVIANYGRKDVSGTLSWRVTGCGQDMTGSIPGLTAPTGGLTSAGTIRLCFGRPDRAVQAQLTLSFGDVDASWPLWVYPRRQPQCPGNVYETKHFDAAAQAVLQQGGVVYLAPDATEEALPGSVKSQFSTDFWSVGTFPDQPGCMGQLIDEVHPVFADFPTSFHTDWQWHPMANSRAMIVPKEVKAIITEMDSYAYMRPMAQLFEGRCGKGRILVSSLGLSQRLQHPEARALAASIYAYLASDRFAPEQELSADLLRSLVP